LDPRKGPTRFVWATGIEDTFITEPWPATGRELDEYELTGHYRMWAEDLELMRDLGVGYARYGVPWHRLNPRPNKWDWTWADRPLERLIELGITPIVDLVHYGLPSWIEGAFLNPDFPKILAEFASKVAERFAGRLFCYTTLNEPRITAWYCGRLGWWPPHGRSWSAFAKVLVSICQAMAMASGAIRAVDPRNLVIHADGADIYSTKDANLREEQEFRQNLVYLPLDLLFGRVSQDHALADWLKKHGISQGQLDWHVDHPAPPDVVGLNLYPMFSNKVLRKARSRLRISSISRVHGLIGEVARGQAARFNRPIMITETAGRGSPQRRVEWLEASIAEVRALRADGIPLIGYTWWPMISHIAWAYRQGTGDIGSYIEKMGLWDIAPERGLARIETKAARRYRLIVHNERWDEEG
jgi:beta-glucosidase/6-phospho-beta-glucosidase/beta-galactosidase